MNKGWSVRVIPAQADEARLPVKWYIVAEAEPEAAIAAVRKAYAIGEARVEAVQRMPILFQGRRLQPGEVAYLYSRGAPRTV